MGRSSKVRKVDANSIAKFLYENILVCFGCPLELVSDYGTHFLNEIITHLLSSYLVVHRKSTLYYPRCNGQAESSNKILCKIITKMVEASRSDWEHKFHAALWAFRITFMVSAVQTPFQMLYGQEAVMPAEFVVPSLRVAIAERLSTEESTKRRLQNILQLHETCFLVLHVLAVEKQRRKAWHDRNIKTKDLVKGELALLYNAKAHKDKLKFQGEGSYKVVEIRPNGVVFSSTCKANCSTRPLTATGCIAAT
ncbi:hypothetical protein O6H91_Y558800 [Diphasiastrum complanatum]|nr:hypothetical protein O6H91_Y558800 [Diphasiastrum complanatum]